MTTKLSLQSSVSASALAAVALALWLAGAAAPAHAQQAGTGPQAAAVTIDADDIGGVVTGAGGPEAGVWVIAEIDRRGRPRCSIRKR
jgi:hypothetical protein